MDALIYALASPLDNRVFYVGATVNKIKRFAQHKTRPSTPTGLMLKETDRIPILIELQSCDSSQVPELEAKWFKIFKRANVELENKRMASSNYSHTIVEKTRQKCQ